MQGLSPEGNAFDLVHMCSTFAADPFAMAFAKRFASGPPPGRRRLEQPEQARAGAAFHAFCRDTFRECIGQVQKPY